ncbi:MAG: rod shape-determining protein MreC [Oscillospiraceae bacterium]|nr:rod shape-determining protein MreC [Oscillospiraceae bacterium]
MRKVMKTAGLVVLSALVLVLALTVIGRLTGRENIFTRSFQSVAAPGEKLVSSAAVKLEELRAALRDYEALQAENEELKARIAAMEEEVRQSQGANAENDRLRQLLELKRSHTDYKLLDASIISWGSSNWSSTFDLDKGSFSGVEVGDCVITETGFVVGVVTETGLYSCSVRTLIDPRAAMGATVHSTGLTAVAEGDFSLMAGGELKLTYVFENSVLELGDTVLTSGAGGVYPAGLVIGKITGVASEEGGYGQYGIVTPSAELSSLSQVFLILEYGEAVP